MIPMIPRSSSRPPRGAALVWLLVAVAAVLFLAVFPQFVKKPYVLHMGIVLFLAIIQGQAWNVIGGYTGQYSVGHAAYFGIGAYSTTMLLVIYGMPPWWGIWLGMVNAIILSLIIGSITFRLRGPYFVLASISVAEIIRLATLHFRGYTRGAEGYLLDAIPTLHLFGSDIEFYSKRPFYFIGLGLAVVTVVVNWAVQHSKLGYYFQAIREDQDAAHSLGINLAVYKNVALAISAAFTALAGGFYAMYVKFIDPSVFGLAEISIPIVLTVIIGGIGTIIGPVIGAMVLVPLSEILRNPKGLVQIGVLPPDSSVVAFIDAHLANAHLLIYGILVVVVILFAPDGVLGVMRSLVQKARRRGERGSAQPATTA
jgi:branched-chain amino acid transport system permease protein